MTEGGSKVFTSIYKVVAKIPKGKVATYGQIARIVQSSKFKNQNCNSKFKITPRLVGSILHKNPDPKSTPCHRVVDRNGKVAVNYAFGGWRQQKKKLKDEGVSFKNKLHVDLENYLWKKEKL